jgi:hypothetical protein
MKYLSRKLLFNVLAGGFVAVFLACTSAPDYAREIYHAHTGGTGAILAEQDAPLLLCNGLFFKIPPLYQLWAMIRLVLPIYMVDY